MIYIVVWRPSTDLKWYRSYTFVNKKMVGFKEDDSNQLFEVLGEWNDHLERVGGFQDGPSI